MNPKLEWQGCLLAAVLISLTLFIADRAEKCDAEQERIQKEYKETPVHLRAKERP